MKGEQSYGTLTALELVRVIVRSIGHACMVI